MPAISTNIRNAAVDAITVLFDGGTGRINVYTGSKPATPATAATGTLLGTLTLSTDAAPAASNGVASWNAITEDASADASGTPGWFRMYNSDETAPGSAGGASDARLDGTVSVTGGGGELQFGNTSFVAGGGIFITSFTLTMPAT
jgi:hypothetical protein